MKNVLNFIGIMLVFGMSLAQGASQYIGQFAVDGLQYKIASVSKEIDNVTRMIRTLRERVDELKDNNLGYQKEMNVVLSRIQRDRAAYRQGGTKRKILCGIERYGDRVPEGDIRRIDSWKGKIERNNHQIKKLQKNSLSFYSREKDRLTARLGNLCLQLNNAVARELDSIWSEIVRMEQDPATLSDEALLLGLTRLKRRKARLMDFVLRAVAEPLDATSSESEDNASQGAAGHDDNPMTHAFA